MSPFSLRVLVVYYVIQNIIDLLLIYAFPIGDGHLIRVVYSFLKPAEYCVYGYLFHQRIQSTFSFHYALWSSLSVWLISLSQQLFLPDSRTVATNIIMVEGLLILVLVLLYYRYILFSNQVISLTREPLFWIATGLLFFYAGNIVATGFYHQLRIYSAPLAKALYQLNYTLGMLNFLLTSIAFIVSTEGHQSHGS